MCEARASALASGHSAEVDGQVLPCSPRPLEVLLKFHGSPGLTLMVDMVDTLGCRDTRLLKPSCAIV